MPIAAILQRHFNRELEEWLKWMTDSDKSILFKQLTLDNKHIILDLTGGLKRALDISKQRKFVMSFHKIYKKSII